MKRVLGFACLALIVLGLIHSFSPRLEAQNRSRNRGNQPRDGVCFCLDSGCRGERFRVNSDERQRNLGEHYNDRISSIQIFGRAEVTVYVDKNFNGSRQTLRQDVPNLGDWNDKITSFEVTGGHYGGRGSGYERRDGACFYMDSEYHSNSFCMNAGEKLRNAEDRFSDQVSSIRVLGRARVVVYEHENFGGASRTFAADVSNSGNFNDKITSIEVR